jgi:hypothetical protein
MTYCHVLRTHYRLQARKYCKHCQWRIGPYGSMAPWLLYGSMAPIVGLTQPVELIRFVRI